MKDEMVDLLDGGNEHDGFSEMKVFEVTVTETLQRKIEFSAHDIYEAEELAHEAHTSEEYVLSAEDFVGVEFTAQEKVIERTAEHDGSEIDYTVEGGTTAMNENNYIGEPLAENDYVQQLFGILSDNGRDTSGLSALLSHVSDMETFVKSAEDTISTMKAQLSEMKEVQDHPVKTALQNTIRSLEVKVAEVKERLVELKSNIVEGCKNAVNAFKEKGISALDKLASFFHVKDNLQDWKKNIQFVIQSDSKAIAKIEAFSAEYHSAGRAVKNMARVAVGKKPIDAKKEAGKLSKVMTAPYRAQAVALNGLKKSIDKAVAKLDDLEANAAERREQRSIEKKPSVLGALAANKERVERDKLEMPVPQKAQVKGAAL